MGNDVHQAFITSSCLLYVGSHHYRTVHSLYLIIKLTGDCEFSQKVFQMEIKKFISKHGDFTVVESFVLDEKGFAWNENIHECIIIAGDTVVLYLEGKDFLDFISATSDVAKQKFLYRQEMTRKNNE